MPADPGFEHWLLKFDGVGMDHELGTGGHYGRIEYAYHLMARSAGTSVPSPMITKTSRSGAAILAPSPPAIS